MRTQHLARTVAAALLIGGLATGGAALAHDGGSPAEPAPSSPAAPTSTQQEKGMVIEAAGSHDGHDVQVFLYENARYGNSLQVVLDPEQDLIGWTEQTTPFVVDGQVDVTVSVDGQPARLTGTVTESGTATKVLDPRQDGGEQIVTRGTHTQLVTDLVLTWAGSEIDLAAAPAFAFDLDVRSTTLYGR